MKAPLKLQILSQSHLSLGGTFQLDLFLHFWVHAQMVGTHVEC